MSHKKKIYFAVMICVAILVFFGIFAFPKIKNRWDRYANKKEQESILLPPPVESGRDAPSGRLYGDDDTLRNNIPKEDAPVVGRDAPTGRLYGEEINLNVPFNSQAPAGNWEMPFQEACEEASVLMVDKFYRKQSFGNAQDTEKEIESMVEFEEKKLGFTPDMTAEETGKFIKNYLGYSDVKVVYDITVSDIKKELTQGRPVIVPAAGRQLGNPNFRQPGPRYHMLVIKGYIKDKFITNDPGTRKGKDYLYDFDTLYNAIHDWNGGEVEKGRKVMIIVGTVD